MMILMTKLTIFVMHNKNKALHHIGGVPSCFYPSDRSPVPERDRSAAVLIDRDVVYQCAPQRPVKFGDRTFQDFSEC